MRQKNELKTFDKKTIAEIQEKYRATYENIDDKPKEISFIELEREKTKNHQMLMKYKKLLDSGKIKEEDIPDEYVEKLRKIYEQEIISLNKNIKKLSK